MQIAYDKRGRAHIIRIIPDQRHLRSIFSYLHISMKKIVFIALLFAFVLPVCAQTDSTKKNKKHFEFSFGQSLLFIGSSQLDSIRKNSSIVIPTSAILFLSELRPDKRLRIPLFLNLPTESKQFIVNGTLISEKASITFGTGLQVKAFEIKIDSRSKVEFEAGILASFIFRKSGTIVPAPVIAGRFKILRGEYFVMYMGASYSLGINAFGVLYGTGSIF
jgi:hypothetical protein